jgi:hypothetical protein
MTEHARSLADTTTNEAVTVRRILFECLQAHCAELGVHEGDLVRVTEEGTATLMLRRPDGSLVRCPPEVARFIEVEGNLGA